MVQEYQSPVSVYKHPFELIMAAYVRRFPTCPLVPVVEDCNVLSESQSEDGSILVTVRRCTVSADMPQLIKKMTGVGYLYFIQKNTLNRRERSMHIEVTNESFSKSLVVHEVCDYTVHPENEDWTCFEQAATLDIKKFFGFERTVEKFAMKQYTMYLEKGKEIIEYYLKEMAEEGITSMPGWSPPPLASPVATAMVPQLPLSTATSVPSANGAGQEGDCCAHGVTGLLSQ